MSGGVEDIYLVTGVVEAHHRGSHRYAALLLYLHPVGGGGLFYLVRLDGSRHVYGSAEQQHLFGERSFPRVGVRYYGKSPSLVYLFFVHSLFFIFIKDKFSNGWAKVIINYCPIKVYS